MRNLVDRKASSSVHLFVGEVVKFSVKLFATHYRVVAIHYWIFVEAIGEGGLLVRQFVIEAAFIQQVVRASIHR